MRSVTSFTAELQQPHQLVVHLREFLVEERTKEGTGVPCHRRAGQATRRFRGARTPGLLGLEDEVQALTVGGPVLPVPPPSVGVLAAVRIAS